MDPDQNSYKRILGLSEKKIFYEWWEADAPNGKGENRLSARPQSMRTKEQVM